MSMFILGFISSMALHFIVIKMAIWRGRSHKLARLTAELNKILGKAKDETDPITILELGMARDSLLEKIGEHVGIDMANDDHDGTLKRIIGELLEGK